MGALEAARLNLIVPVLVGPAARIRALASGLGADISNFRLVNTEHSHASAEAAVTLARNGEVETLMKGSLHTDEIMTAVVSSQGGLRTERRVSHVFVMDVPAYDRILFVTDAAINIEPTLREKADIAQNAIDLARSLGIESPKVAILSAVEMVNPDISSTIDAAALCKMADRGQIRGAVLDGPLAFDNAISELAARTKSIHSPVAGRADILLVPNIEAGNMLAKQLQYFAGADSAGHRARRARAGDPDEPRRQRAHAHRLGGGRQARRARATRGGTCRSSDGRGRPRRTRDPGAERRIVEHQVLRLPARRRAGRARLARPGVGTRHGAAVHVAPGRRTRRRCTARRPVR